MAVIPCYKHVDMEAQVVVISIMKVGDLSRLTEART